MIFSVMEARRKAMKMSQFEVAKHLNCSQPEISLMERGMQSIPEAKAAVLGQLFGVEPDMLQQPYEKYLELLKAKDGDPR